VNIDRALAIAGLLLAAWPIWGRSLKEKWAIHSRRSIEKELQRIDSPDYHATQQHLAWKGLGAAIYCIAAYLYFSTGNPVLRAVAPIAQPLLAFLGMLAAGIGTAAIPMAETQKGKYRAKLMQKHCQTPRCKAAREYLDRRGSSATSFDSQGNNNVIVRDNTGRRPDLLLEETLSTDWIEADKSKIDEWLKL
jgi:hypothetical protein